MNSILIKNAKVVNEGTIINNVNLFIKDGNIQKVGSSEEAPSAYQTIDASGLYLLPGVIDDQVHFREPGLTHKGEIESESAAAVAGGITSYMEMPNTIPQATSIHELEKKFEIAEQKSFANYSFYLGATNNNINEIKQVNPKQICGVKVFMGSSTGNMLVDSPNSLQAIFAESPTIVVTHCEDEATIKHNIERYKKEMGEDIPFSFHPIIRSAEACYKSSSLAVDLAKKYGTKLHILHLSSARELDLLDSSPDVKNKNITGEVCVHHLWFNSNDYDKYGARIKWNPAVKFKDDQAGLFEGLLKNKLDVVATDHAPHTLEEKSNKYFNAPSGGPLVQHALVAMLEFYHQGKIRLETIVQKMCHNPAELFNIKDRGYIREGYAADLVLVDLNDKWEVQKENLLYKCKWSPFEGTSFSSKIKYTLVNGKVVYENGKVLEKNGQRLEFNR